MVLPCFACVCVHRSVCGQAMAQAPRSSAVVQCLRAEYDWVSREGRVPFYRNKEVCQLWLIHHWKLIDFPALFLPFSKSWALQALSLRWWPSADIRTSHGNLVSSYEFQSASPRHTYVTWFGSRHSRSLQSKSLANHTAVAFPPSRHGDGRPFPDEPESTLHRTEVGTVSNHAKEFMKAWWLDVFQTWSFDCPDHTQSTGRRHLDCVVGVRPQWKVSWCRCCGDGGRDSAPLGQRLMTIFTRDHYTKIQNLQEQKSWFQTKIKKPGQAPLSSWLSRLRDCSHTRSILG